MSNKQSYIIRIRYDTPDGSSVGEAPDSGVDNGKGKAESKQEPKVTPASIVTPFVKMGMQTGMQMQSQYINTVTGSGQLARRQELINGLVSTTVDVATNAMTGASVAASLGLAAGPVGAVAGIAIAAVSEVFKIATRAADIRNQQEVESTAITATKARAGISWNRSRR